MQKMSKDRDVTVAEQHEHAVPGLGHRAQVAEDPPRHIRSIA
jgi:hypothetical protein